jgi:hypothetical protein
MSALHHAKTEQRGSSFSHKPHSQHDDSSYSATDDSDDDNLPLASKGCVSLTTRMAITRAAQQSRPRGNVETSSRSRANKIPHDSKFSRPLPAIRKGGTSDNTKNKKKTNSKKRDKDGPPDGSGLGGATTPPVESNNNDLQQSHNNDPPSKRRSSRKKKDNAKVIGGNEIHAMDVGNGGDNANRKTTDNAKEVLVGGNEIHAAVHGGNGGIDATVDFLGCFNDEELDGSNESSADDHFVNDTSAMVIDTESKKEIVLVSKDVLRKMIQLLSKEGMSENPPVNLLRNLIPYEEYLLQLAGQLDNKMSYVDERMQRTTVTDLVKRTFESFEVSVEGMFERNEDGTTLAANARLKC